jgi:hypothetical protein
VAQAARLTRFVERKPKQGAREPKAVRIETEWLLSSRPQAALPAHALLTADRRYWGIENGLHLRLDVSGGEDRSRVRHRTAALNLAMIRRATLSVGIHWIQHCPKPRQATLQGFYDFMHAKHAQKAFSLVTASKTAWLP